MFLRFTTICFAINLSTKNPLKDLTQVLDCSSSPFVGLKVETFFNQQIGIH